MKHQLCFCLEESFYGFLTLKVSVVWWGMCCSAAVSWAFGLHFINRRSSEIPVVGKGFCFHLSVQAMPNSFCTLLCVTDHLCPLQSLPMPYQRPQSFLRMWRILRPRFDFHGLTRLLVLIISRPVFQSSWPATTYSDPGEKKREQNVIITQGSYDGWKSL